MNELPLRISATLDRRSYSVHASRNNLWPAAKVISPRRVQKQGTQASSASSVPMFSSIAMSLNSLESKTSPHSWHSTNSASSSRATTRTRGCLQSFCISVVLEGCFSIGEIWTGFIFGFRRLSHRCLSRIAGILSPLCGLSSVSASAQEITFASVPMDEDSYSRVAEIFRAADKYRRRVRLELGFV